MSVKIGISIPKKLAAEVEELMKLLGIDNRSKVVNEALKMYINYHKQLLSNNEIVSVIILMYDNKISGSRISDLRHQYKNLVVTLNHIDGICDKCLELILIKGPSQKIAEFLGKLYLINDDVQVYYIPILSMGDDKTNE